MTVDEVMAAEERSLGAKCELLDYATLVGRDGTDDEVTVVLYEQSRTGWVTVRWAAYAKGRALASSIIETREEPSRV